MKKYLSILVALLVMVGTLALPVTASAKCKPGKIYSNKSMVYVQKK